MTRIASNNYCIMTHYIFKSVQPFASFGFMSNILKIQHLNWVIIQSSGCEMCVTNGILLIVLNDVRIESMGDNHITGGILLAGNDPKLTVFCLSLTLLGMPNVNSTVELSVVFLVLIILRSRPTQQGMKLLNTAKVDTTNVARKKIYKAVYHGSDDSLTFESWRESISLMKNDRPSEYIYYESKISTGINFTSLNTVRKFSIVFQEQDASSHNVYFNGTVNFSVVLNDSLSIDKTDCICSKTICILTTLSSILSIDNYDDVKSGCVLLYDNSNKATIDDYRSGGWDHCTTASAKNSNVYFIETIVQGNKR